MEYFLAYSNRRDNFIVEASDLATAEANVTMLAIDGERIRVRPMAAVLTVADAWELFHDAVAYEDYRDNYRAAFADDAEGMAEFDDASAAGCCGSADIAYLVSGRLFYIGCNYGH